MPRKNTTGLELENRKLREELAKLRDQVETQSSASAALKSRLTAVGGGVNTPWSELMVGIRNVSDYTIGIPPILPGDAPIQLAPNFSGSEPGSVATITYAAWRELRKGSLIEKGMLVRDDSILGTAFMPAPVDQKTELAPGHAVNTIEDPLAWIEARGEEELREDIGKITSQASLFRLRRVVDENLRHLEESSGMPRETREQQAKVAQYALGKLSTKLRLVDDLTTTLIETRARSDTSLEATGRKVSIKL